MEEIQAMWNRTLMILTVTAALVLGIYAQNPSTPPSPPTPAEMVANLVARLTTLLDLTTAQQEQAKAIFTAQQAALGALKDDREAVQQALQTAVKANDITGIKAAAAAIGQLAAQEALAHALADAAFYALLTADQQAKYNELKIGGIGGPGPWKPGPAGPAGGLKQRGRGGPPAP